MCRVSHWAFTLHQSEHWGLSYPKPWSIPKHHPAALVLAFWYFNIQYIVAEPAPQSALVPRLKQVIGTPKRERPVTMTVAAASREGSLQQCYFQMGWVLQWTRGPGQPQ